jgi:hypothetical protein
MSSSLVRLSQRLLLLLLLPIAAQSADVHVPDELQDWQSWVLQDKEYRNCPFYFNRGATERSEFICAWPGTLSVAVDEDSGQFSQQWTVYAEDAWIPLPGDAAYWPDRVLLNGSPAMVVERGGKPSVRVAPGSWRLSGQFEWDDRPGVLRIPTHSGMVSLTVNGQRIARPEIDRNGVFLGERERETQARDDVSVQVYRLVTDGVPTRLETTLQIDVSGSVREEFFGPVLPEGFVPVKIQSSLPAKLESDGRLRVQVRPGRWEVSLTARAPSVLNSVGLADVESNLPDDEIWSFRSNDRLRVATAEGLPPVDPTRVQVPEQWRQLPAYRINKGESLEINERSRGMVAADNDLGLERRMWLDFGGDGFVVRDYLSGTMRTDWRLDMQPPFALKSATENEENLLITNGAEDGYVGVELRRSDLEVTTLGRSVTRSAMPVTGWDARFTDVSTVLYLPPGHKLITAPGADVARGSWFGQWELLDFFMVLIITIAAWKLFGRTSGIIALLALALSFHEINAPSWLWLNLLIAIALLRVAPVGKLRTSVTTYLAASTLFLVLALVPFVADQLRVAIYPQLEPQIGVHNYSPGRGSFGFSDALAPAVNAPVSQAELKFEGEGMVQEDRANAARERVYAADAVSSLEEIVVMASKSKLSSNYARYAPNAIVQAGPGIPSWQWNAYRLAWNGPVDADQSLRLVILPRWAVTLLRFFEVLMLLLFTAVLAAEMLKRRWTLPGGLAIGRSAASVLAVGFLSVSMLAGPTADADVPDVDMLNELQSRLMQPPDCVPRCAEILSANVEIGADSVNMRLSISALEDVAIPLPGAANGWRPDTVLVDGAAAARVVRLSNGNLWLRVTPGQHTVTLRGSAVGVDSLEIPFPTPPRVIKASGDGWFIAGIKDRRLLSGSLQLTRLQTEEGGDGAPRWESNRFPAFVYVHRTIELGLDWRVTTSVNRIAPTQGALTLELPLLAGETVVTDEMTVEDGHILVSMNPQQSSVTWQSNLPLTSPLALTAEAGAAWVETWYVGVGTVWHTKFSGVPESEVGNSGSRVRMAEFHPRGGETLTINATRPDAADGSTLAFDSVSVSVDQGARSSTTNMVLRYRSTRGAEHDIQIPENADVTEVKIDGRTEPLHAEDGNLMVPIVPGEHTIEITWREDGEVGARTQTPDVDIGAPASNITMNLSLPENRWLLATRGPRLGPAVLYWSELAVLILLAWILGRIDWTPLRTHHWLLLGLGFSTFNWPVLGFVAAWILVVGAREKWRRDVSWWQFNLAQTLVVALTAVALTAIVISLPSGLLGEPNMHVTGNNSYGNALSWFADRSDSALPAASALTVPMWIYKAFILGWALWLSFALLKWLPWTWQCFAREGFFRSRQHDKIRETTSGN